VAVDLTALDRLLLHEPCPWLWIPRAIVGSQTACGNILSPRSCISEQPLLAHLSRAFKISQSCLILSQLFFRQGILLNDNKGAVSCHPYLPSLSLPQLRFYLSPCLEAKPYTSFKITWYHGFKKWHDNTIWFSIPSLVFLSTCFSFSKHYRLLSWHFDNTIIISRTHSCVETESLNLINLLSIYKAVFLKLAPLEPATGMTCLHGSCADSSPMCHIYLWSLFPIQVLIASVLSFTWIYRSATKFPTWQHIGPNYILFIHACSPPNLQPPWC